VIRVQFQTVSYKSHVIASSVVWCRFLSEQILVQSPHGDVTGACNGTCHIILKVNILLLLFDFCTHMTLEGDLSFLLIFDFDEK
jgi:hypothetical protein